MLKAGIHSDLGRPNSEFRYGIRWRTFNASVYRYSDFGFDIQHLAETPASLCVITRPVHRVAPTVTSFANERLWGKVMEL